MPVISFLNIDQISTAVREGVLQATSHTNIADISSVISSIGLLIATIVLVYYTKVLAIEAKKTREQQTAPNVIIYAAHDNDRPTIILLVIKNIGHGLAKNIRFEMSKQINTAFGINKASIKKIAIDSGPLITGIPALGPGESRVLNWGQPAGLQDEIGSSIVDITCIFESANGVEMPRNICGVDIESFKNCAGHSSIELRAVNALEGINSELKRLSR